MFAPFLHGSATFQENPLTKAIQLFDREKFSEAEPIFKSILDQRPDDFMVNYFYGACRTENGHYSDEDLNYLVKASKEVTPLNIDYYFAIQYHAKNQWDKAFVYYKLYRDIANDKEEEKVNLSQKMEQCENHINPFAETQKTEENQVVPVVSDVVATSAIPEPDKSEGNNPTVLTSVTIDTTLGETLKKTIETVDSLEVASENDSSEKVIQTEDSIKVAEPVLNQPAVTTLFIQTDERIEFNINSLITYLKISNFKTADGEIYFKEGNEKQAELDGIIKETENLRTRYSESESKVEKDSIGLKILDLENKSYELKGVVNQLFMQSKTAENAYWQAATPAETEYFIKELNAVLEEDKKNENKPPTFVDPVTMNLTPEVIDGKETEPSAAKENTAGISYKIQIGAFSRGIPNNLKPVFNKISLIRKVENYTDEKGVVVYTTGNLTNYDDAVVMQNQVRQEGIKDPIIAAYLNGKRITLEQAKETEKKK